MDKTAILLDQKSSINIKSLTELRESFKGYNKVISTLLMSYLGLPIWDTLILKELNPKSQNLLEAFLSRSSTFFIRTDTYKNRVDNVACKVCPKNQVMEKIELFKKVSDRYILILATPDVSNQAYKNIASCRTGIINGNNVQEWVGPGFSEYHLAKDKFPHKTKLHAHLTVSENSNVYFLHKASAKQLKTDINQLIWAYGAEQLNLKGLFSTKELTNDAYETSYLEWRSLESNRLDKPETYVDAQIKALGKKFLLNMGDGESELINHYLNLKKGIVWEPSVNQINQVQNLLATFISKAHLIGLDPKEKILSLSLNPHASSSGVVCWDVFNLLK